MNITFHPPTFQLSPEMAELSARIADPQDLEDGLLAVRYDEAAADIIRRMDERMVSLFLSGGIGQKP